MEFLNSYQRDPRLNEILYPYANPDRAKDIFNQYEPCESNIAKGTPEGFISDSIGVAITSMLHLCRLYEPRRIFTFSFKRG